MWTWQHICNIKTTAINNTIKGSSTNKPPPSPSYCRRLNYARQHCSSTVRIWCNLTHARARVTSTRRASAQLLTQDVRGWARRMCMSAPWVHGARVHVQNGQSIDVTQYWLQRCQRSTSYTVNGSEHGEEHTTKDGNQMVTKGDCRERRRSTCSSKRLSIQWPNQWGVSA